MPGCPQLYCQVQWQDSSQDNPAARGRLRESALENNRYLHQASVPDPPGSAQFRPGLQQWALLRNPVLNRAAGLVLLAEHADHRSA